MKICIYGAGAIGGYLGVSLAEAGCTVSLIARGAHMKAIQQNGLTLRMASGERVAKLACTDKPEELGPQDYVIVALKANAVPAIADRLAPLFHKETAVVTAANGMPWWYFHGLTGPYKDLRLETVDPGGRQWTRIGPERAIGCVVYPACEVVEPGVIQHLEGDRFTLGEPSGETTQRVTKLADTMRKGGLKAPVKARIREEIWVKLWGNVAFNPLSALTHGTLGTLASELGTRGIARVMMQEAEAIAGKLGITMPITLDKRIDGALAIGAHKTSMLQDLERGRPMEIDAIVGSVQELGKLTGVPTPMIDVVLTLVVARAKAAGCY